MNSLLLPAFVCCLLFGLGGCGADNSFQPPNWTITPDGTVAVLRVAADADDKYFSYVSTHRPTNANITARPRATTIVEVWIDPKTDAVVSTLLDSHVLDAASGTNAAVHAAGVWAVGSQPLESH